MRCCALALLLPAVLGACRPAPATAPAPARPVTLTRGPGVLIAQGSGPFTVTCDTPAGPLVRALSAPARLVLPPGTGPCETGGLTAKGTDRPSPAPPDPIATPDAAPTAAPVAAPPPGPSTDPQAAVTGGALRVTPGLIRLGEREVWTVTADLRGPDGNPAPDGTPVTLSGEGRSGERLEATRLTVSGVARWQLTPATAGPFTFTAASGSWTARARATARSGLLGSRPAAVFTGRQLTLGPLRWTDGALPDDGTPVRLSALNRAGRTVWSAAVPVAAGEVLADVPRVPDAVTLRVELAGSEVRFAWR